MSETPDYTDPATLVRLLISDVDTTDQLFTDDEIGAFLALEGDVVKKGAALALETIASNEVLVAKVIRTQDLTTDGAKVAAELRASAKTLRQQAADDATAAGDDVFFDIVPGYLDSPEHTNHPGLGWF